MKDSYNISSAHHEAGHAIIALSRGIVPKHVEIYFNEANERWEGTTELPEFNDMEVEEKIEVQIGICFGGCFAQVKHAIRKLDPECSIPWKELLDWMVDPSKDPLQLQLTDDSTVDVPAWWFKDLDQQQLAYISDVTTESLGHHNFVGLLQRGVRKLAIPVLEDPVWWGNLEEFAENIVKAISDDRGRLEPPDYSDLAVER